MRKVKRRALKMSRRSGVPVAVVQYFRRDLLDLGGDKGNTGRQFWRSCYAVHLSVAEMGQGSGYESNLMSHKLCRRCYYWIMFPADFTGTIGRKKIVEGTVHGRYGRCGRYPFTSNQMEVTTKRRLKRLEPHLPVGTHVQKCVNSGGHRYIVKAWTYTK